MQGMGGMACLQCPCCFAVDASVWHLFNISVTVARPSSPAAPHAAAFSAVRSRSLAIAVSLREVIQGTAVGRGAVFLPGLLICTWTYLASFKLI